MSQKIGRNNLCPCGSEKKYKKCCMEENVTSASNVTTVDFKWQQLRRLEGAVIDQHLIPYAMEELPKEVLERALFDFFPEELPQQADKELLFHQFFLPWFLFNWIPEDDFGLKRFDPEKTLAQNYVDLHEDQLNSQKRLFIEAMNQSYYSFYSVLQVEVEKFLLIKDILLGTTHIIKERQGTYQLKRGDIILSRILTLEDQSLFVGMAPFIIPASYQNDFIDFRKWLIKENDGASLTAKELRDEFEIILFDCFFDIMQNVYNQPLPTLANTDGDIVEFSKTYFKLMIAPEEALNHLSPLTLNTDEDELLQSSKKDKSGQIKKIEFPWLAKGNKLHKNWNNTILGHITIEQGRLILETNSKERTQLGKKLLSQYLGEALSFQKTLIEAPMQKMKSLPNSKLRKDEESNKLLELPEIQEQIKAMAKAHWEGWFDEPIPLLKNKTPRESAKTKEGRERLEALLLHYERHDLEKENNLFKTDIFYLKRELGLDLDLDS